MAAHRRRALRLCLRRQSSFSLFAAGASPRLRNATLIPVLATLVFLLGFHGKDLDVNYSARPLARGDCAQAPDVKLVAVEDIKRDMDYGLAFYRNEPMIHYDTDGVPDAGAPAGDSRERYRKD